VARAVSSNLLLALEGLERSVVGRDPVRVDVLVAERVPDPAVDDDAGARVAKGLLRVLRVVELLVAEALRGCGDRLQRKISPQAARQNHSELSKNAHPVNVGRAVVRLLVAVADIDVARLLFESKRSGSALQSSTQASTHCLERESPWCTSRNHSLIQRQKSQSSWRPRKTQPHAGSAPKTARRGFRAFVATALTFLLVQRHVAHFLERQVLTLGLFVDRSRGDDCEA
jgi:hypothetical protein